jgi:hypothetical protein
MSASPNSATGARTTPLKNPAVEKALGILLEGYDYAQDLQASPWEFAVELPTLLAAGCTSNTLRWLVLRGYAEQAVRSPEGRAANGATSADGTCFVLTALGASIARSGSPLSAIADSSTRIGQEHGETGPETPAWDNSTGELRFLGQLVKRFRNAASNQRALLDAFQKLGWPERIVDPLPRPGDRSVHVKQRLHDAIKNLNRGHQARCLHFHGADAGRAVGWKRLT